MANATVNLSLVKSGYVREDNPSTVYPTNSSSSYPCRDSSFISIGKHLYFGFSHLSDSLKNRRIYNVRLRVQCDGSGFRAYACKADFNPSTLCWDNAPAPFYHSSQGWLSPESVLSGLVDQWLDPSSYYQTTAAPLFLKYYTCFLEDTIDYVAKTVLSGGGAPYLEVTYDDSINVKSKITPRSAPADGYVNPRNATSFSWAFERDSTETYYCAGDFTQASAALKWKTSGSDTWNTVNASGSTQNLSVAANTFPTATTIEWYLTGTDTAGTTSESEHFTFSTAAGTASAIPVSPVNSVEDGSQRIVLRWTLTSTDGQEPIYVDLQHKMASTESWTSAWSKHAATDHCNVGANYFSAGVNQWRVRAYNVDDVAGPWCDVNGSPPSFICVAAPAAPQGLTATESPRPTISWQATGQEAYEIEIDGESVVKAYSPSVNSWKKDIPLEDGEHVIRVRIQGVYGLWSSWSSVTINVENAPPTTALLSGWFDVDAELHVEIADVTEIKYVHWYRDGKYIAKTYGTQNFIDRTVLGEHTWFAEYWYVSGNYVRSNPVTGTLKSCETRIAAIDYGSSWLTLNLSENSDSLQSFNWSQTSSLRHVRGSAFPVLEMGEDEDLSGSYDCAFTNVKEARMLEALKGRVVIIKSRGGNVLIGAMTRLAKRMKDFYIAYSFSVQQIQWEDFVNYDENA